MKHLFLKKLSLASVGLFIAFQFGSASTVADQNHPANAPDSTTTTSRTLDADGIPVITTSGDANENPRGTVDIAQAGRQYVQQQQQRENQTSGRMTETFGFGIGLIALLAVGIIAYAIHPNKREQ